MPRSGSASRSPGLGVRRPNTTLLYYRCYKDTPAVATFPKQVFLYGQAQGLQIIVIVSLLNHSPVFSPSRKGEGKGHPFPANLWEIIIISAA